MNIVLINTLFVDEKYLKEQKSSFNKMGHYFSYYLAKPKDDEELISRVKDADIIIDDKTPLREKILKKCAKLKYIDVAFTGIDHIDVDYCKENNIKISNAQGYATEGVAELTVSFILAFLRNILPLDSLTRNHCSKGNIIGKEIKEKTVGIIGTGAIGIRTIELLKPFGTKIIAFSRTIKKEVIEMSVEYKELKDVMKYSDIISINVPLNSDTNKLINKDMLDLMKPDALLINTARGGVLDEEYLTEILKNKKIAGACLDVFEEEPPLNETYNELLSLSNVILTPHVAYFTEEAMKKRAEIAFDNLYSYLNNSVNFKNRII